MERTGKLFVVLIDHLFGDLHMCRSLTIRNV